MPYLSNHSAVGDPGFFGALGRMAKGATIGLLTGGPAGAVLGAAGGLAGVPQAGLPASNAGMLANRPQVYSGRMVNTVPTNYPPPMGLPHVPAPVGSPGSVMPTGTYNARGALQAAGMIPKGYRLNKSDYFLKDGTFVPRGTRYVRYRTRNNLNQKALRRAISRAQGFDKLVKRNRKGLRALARI